MFQSILLELYSIEMALALAARSVSETLIPDILDQAMARLGSTDIVLVEVPVILIPVPPTNVKEVPVGLFSKSVTRCSNAESIAID